MNTLRFSLVLLIGFSSVAFGWGAKNTAAVQAIKTVSIDPNVKMPTKMQFTGLTEMLTGAAVVGAVGPAGVAAMGPDRRVGPYYNIPQALREEMAAALEKSGKVVKKQGPADAILHIEVRMYGFSSAEMFARRVNPELMVEAKLIRNDGAQVWRFGNYVSHLNSGTPAILPEKIKENPQLGVDAFRAAAHLCGQKAAEKLQKN